MLEGQKLKFMNSSKTENWLLWAKPELTLNYC